MRTGNCRPTFWRRLKLDGCEIVEDAFTAKTPKGEIAMKNIIGRFPGKSGRAIVITGHFDTKLFPGRKFVGANDGGSSTGPLLELARVLASPGARTTFMLCFSMAKKRFGKSGKAKTICTAARHLAARWQKDGTLARVKALINVDMIGDKSLNIKQETQSNRTLNKADLEHGRGARVSGLFCGRDGFRG